MPSCNRSASPACHGVASITFRCMPAHGGLGSLGGPVRCPQEHRQRCRLRLCWWRFWLIWYRVLQMRVEQVPVPCAAAGKDPAGGSALQWAHLGARAPEAGWACEAARARRTPPTSASSCCPRWSSGRTMPPACRRSCARAGSARPGWRVRLSGSGRTWSRATSSGASMGPACRRRRALANPKTLNPAQRGARALADLAGVSWLGARAPPTAPRPCFGLATRALGRSGCRRSAVLCAACCCRC